MQAKDNQRKSNHIYLKSTRKWVNVSESFYHEYTRYNDTYRHRMQAHGQCACPKSKFWLCDGDCLVCEYRCSGDILSLDYERENADGEAFSLMDSIPDDSPLMEDVVADRLLLEQLIQRLRELDPEGDAIISMLSDGASDREIARQLGRPQRTFARQMQRYRAELRSLRGY